VFVLIDGVIGKRILLLNRLHGLSLLLFLLLLFMGVDTSDEESIAIILDVLNVGSW
jgi:hypothetical protein